MKSSRQRPKQCLPPPGHGPVGDGSVLEAQKQFSVGLRAEVEKRMAKSPEVQKEMEAIRQALFPRHAQYIDATPKALIPFEAQVAQVYEEMTGKDFPK